ncbi:MAG TPA: T9SS type A sorting domain-containing protein [Flavobacteriaceae bacterium]|nr:T9SS type A sorting domain-containing protein [Flavobacteriaceae bacterium]
MKKTLLILLLISSFGVQAQIVNIPDANFKNALLNQHPTTVDTNGNGEIEVTEASAYTSDISVQNENISDLTGIEAFVNIPILNCEGNNLTSLDFSQNVALKHLNCSANPLTNLDLSQNTVLKKLDCSSTNLTTLNLTQNALLKELNIGNNNQLTFIDLSQNTALESIEVSHGNLTSLDLTQNTALESFKLFETQFTNLDLTQNVNLKEIVLNTNLLLTEIDLRNGKNEYITNFAVHNNPNITCVLVNDAIYSQANWTSTDLVSVFSETPAECGAKSIYFPDTNFKNALINHTPVIDTNADGEIQVAEAILFSGTINVSNQNISNLTGILYFTNITGLQCADNNLKDLDIRTLSALTTLDCKNNQLSKLVLTHNTALTYVDASNNQLRHFKFNNGNNQNVTFFDASGNFDLYCIRVDNPVYCEANWTNIAMITGFILPNSQCTGGTITVPDPNFKAELVSLFDSNVDGEIQSTEVGGFSGTLYLNNKNISDLTGIEYLKDLTELYCSDNNLTSLDLSQNTELEFLWAPNNQLTSLNVSKNMKLKTLIVNNNQLTSLNIDNNINLENLSCSNNQLSSLNLTQNIELGNLSCSFNQLTNLNVNQNVLLQNINCGYNQLTSLDISQNIDLTYLSCSNNLLTVLDLRNGNLQNLELYAQNNPNLICIFVDDALYAENNPFFIAVVDNNSSFVDSEAECDALNSNPTDIVNIPNANFKNALLNHTPVIDTNSDNEIQYSEATNVSSLDIQNEQISDLTGIEAFSNLTSLNCANNNLSNLDISENSVLQSLNSDNNQLQQLDVRNGNNSNFSFFSALNNPSLTCIFVDDKIFSTANWSNIGVNSNFMESYTECNIVNIPDVNFKNALIAQNIDNNNDGEIQYDEVDHITHLYIGNLQISDLTGIEAFDSLVLLECDGNNLSSINLSKNTALEILNCANNQLTAIDLGNNLQLKELYCNNNQLSSLDISKNHNLIKLNADWNQLTSIDIRNAHNDNLQDYSSLNNPNLSCIYVDNSHYSFFNWFNVDAASNFVETTVICDEINGTAPPVYIPDPDFKARLLTHNPVIDTNQDGQIQYTEAAAVEILNLKRVVGANPSEKIEDLTGIEAFVNLVHLDCEQNNLTSLDLSQNTALKTINCSQNNIASLVLGQNTVLKSLNCSVNELTVLDLSQNTNLEFLDCSGNDLTNIDISQNTALKGLNCSTNLFTSLDISQNNALELLYCQVYSLSQINYSPNNTLKYLDCSYTNFINLDVSPFSNLKVLVCEGGAVSANQLQSLNLGQINTLEYIDCSGNQLTTLNTSQVPNLNYLDISENQFSNTNFAQNINLEFLDCSRNQLTALNVQNNNNLKFLDCSENQLTALDLQNNNNLEFLGCGANQITSLDVSQNPELEILYCGPNQLTFLDVRNGNNQNFGIYGGYNSDNNPNLTCIYVDNAQYSEMYWSIYADPASTFVETQADCNAITSPLVYIPDVNFENALLNHSPVIDINVDGEIHLSEAEAFTGTLDISNQNITDLTGLETFINITGLNCSNNNIGAINLSKKTARIFLNKKAKQKGQTVLVNINGNGNLTFLDCSNNQISNLDLSQNTLLTEINCGSNQLIGLDMRNGNNHNISALNVLNNPNLTCIFVDNSNYMQTNWNNAIDPISNFVETQADCDALAIDTNFMQSIEVYPNPVTNQLFIYIPGHDSKKLELEIVNITGEIILKTKIDKSKKLNLSSLASGVYFLKIQEEEKYFVEKLIKL